MHCLVRQCTEWKPIMAWAHFYSGWCSSKQGRQRPWLFFCSLACGAGPLNHRLQCMQTTGGSVSLAVCNNCSNLFWSSLSCSKKCCIACSIGEIILEPPVRYYVHILLQHFVDLSQFFFGNIVVTVVTVVAMVHKTVG